MYILSQNLKEIYFVYFCQILCMVSLKVVRFIGVNNTKFYTFIEVSIKYLGIFQKYCYILPKDFNISEYNIFRKLDLFPINSIIISI